MNFTCLFNFSGFARLWGYPVGILGNNGVLFSESALKVRKQCWRKFIHVMVFIRKHECQRHLNKKTEA